MGEVSTCVISVPAFYRDSSVSFGYLFYFILFASVVLAFGQQ